jgi:hypothetical protein
VITSLVILTDGPLKPSSHSIEMYHNYHHALTATSPDGTRDDVNRMSAGFQRTGMSWQFD